MSHCTTWHIRIDLVDDVTGVAARAKLIGAPMAMTTRHDTKLHDGCLAGCLDVDYLSNWRALDDLTPVLVDALSLEHRAHSAPTGHPAAEPTAQSAGGTA